MTEEVYRGNPAMCQEIAIKMLEEALKAARNGEWDHAHYFAGDARIWLEGCYD